MRWPWARCGAILVVRVPPGPAGVPTHMTESIRTTATPWQPRRVLLVDRNAAARGRLADVLRGRGYEVVEAADSAAGLVEVRQGSAIALIVLELACGEDASWVVNEQRESLLAAAIPVLAFTGDATHPHEGGLVQHRITSKADLVDELLKTKPELAGACASRRFH